MKLSYTTSHQLKLIAKQVISDNLRSSDEINLISSFSIKDEVRNKLIKETLEKAEGNKSNWINSPRALKSFRKRRVIQAVNQSLIELKTSLAKDKAFQFLNNKNPTTKEIFSKEMIDFILRDINANSKKHPYNFFDELYDKYFEEQKEYLEIDKKKELNTSLLNLTRMDLIRGELYKKIHLNKKPILKTDETFDEKIKNQDKNAQDFLFNKVSKDLLKFSNNNINTSYILQSFINQHMQNKILPLILGQALETPFHLISVNGFLYSNIDKINENSYFIEYRFNLEDGETKKPLHKLKVTFNVSNENDKWITSNLEFFNLESY